MHLMIPDQTTSVFYTDSNNVIVDIQYRTFTLQSCMFDGLEPIRVINAQQAHFIHLTLSTTTPTPRTTWELDIHVTDKRITYTRNMLKTRFHGLFTGRSLGAAYCWDIPTLESRSGPHVVTAFANALHNAFHKHILPRLDATAFTKSFHTLAHARDRLHDGDLYRFISLQLTRPTQRTQAARRITRMLKRAFSDPTHPVCQKRLLREFEELPSKKQKLTSEIS